MKEHMRQVGDVSVNAMPVQLLNQKKALIVVRARFGFCCLRRQAHASLLIVITNAIIITNIIWNSLNVCSFTKMRFMRIVQQRLTIIIMCK